ncbi:uncharacterized protein LOC132706088 [Cylas formicarius]|uniref:uncharacterized protein LOC132706088 n=1 Tax=Cylas formicarius TaxID=197179 RepID=UPI0029589651|nr:uncharacterized protein LOC132706088 [Cylas formicarius]
MIKRFGILVLVIANVSVLANLIKEAASLDSFENDTDEASSLSPDFARRLKPTEDALLLFINKLVNTGYISSKITLSRIEKASDKRREIGEQVARILDELPSYRDKVPLVDEIPHVLK